METRMPTRALNRTQSELLSSGQNRLADAVECETFDGACEVELRRLGSKGIFKINHPGLPRVVLT
jgi:hypothetical protein